MNSVLAAGEIGVRCPPCPATDRCASLIEARPRRPVQSEMLCVATVRGDPHEGLRHEAGDVAHLAADLGADLTISGQAIAGPQRVVEGEVQLQLTRRVLVVALDHVETHGLAVLDDLHEGRAQLLELVDVIAVRLRDAAGRAPVLATLGKANNPSRSSLAPRSMAVV